MSRSAVVVAVVAAMTRVGAGDELSSALEKIPAGQSVFFAAELGTTPDILGLGVERNLMRTDANGDTHRVHASKYVEVAVNDYKAEMEQVDNAFLLDAHAHYLFVRANVKTTKTKRYMVARVYQVDRVAKLVTESKPLANAPMYASKIYYGWALYVVIEGEASTFTADVAAELLKVGGKLGTAIEKNKLTSKVHAIGLKPKEGNNLPVAFTLDEVKASFEPSATAQPIFVEYTLQRDLDVDAIPWVKRDFKPGRYFAKVDMSVMDQKADGRAWDAGSLPDPHVTLFVNQKPVTGCKQQDSTESHCIHDVPIDIDQNTVINITAVDKDVAEDDWIGATRGLQVMTSGGTPGTEILLTSTGQIRWVKLTLTPVQ